MTLRRSGSYHEHGARRASDHRLGGTAQKDSVEPTTAVRSDHHEIRSDSVACVYDRLRSRSHQHRDLGTKREPLQRRIELVTSVGEIRVRRVTCRHDAMDCRQRDVAPRCLESCCTDCRERRLR